jgi:protein-disulfide isomerase
MDQQEKPREGDQHPNNHMQNLPERSSNTKRFLPYILILLAVLLVALFLIPPGEDREPPDTATLRAIGPETAPVTITEFADFGCFTCKAWHQFGIREEILAQYGNQIRFVWRDFPVTTPQSPRAAEAGWCAHDQDQFWAYHEILYANAPAFSDPQLKAYAVEIGLDAGRFNACLEGREHQASVENERLAAQDLGLRSVPSFLVNQQRLIGPPSYDQLVTIIEEILASVE